MGSSDQEPGLHRATQDAIVPPILLEPADEADERPAVTRTWVRLLLVAVALAWIGVFAIAAWLNPYRDGQPLLEATHRQLGLPACNFRMLTDLPCPSCGMTTSFSLLMHGDVVNSLRANFVGTILALIGLAFFPWALVSVIRGRWLGVSRVEPWLVRLVFAWVLLMLLRWAAVLAWMRFSD